ncbi:MAG: endonuclease/exonuclease/phosphatase family protein, partial [Steroidobacteraceae bacterium]
MSGCRQAMRALGTGAMSLAVLVLTGCVSPAGDDTARASGNRSLLRVMSFNIEWGGAHVRFESVVEAIRAAGADVVGVQEPEGNLERLANDLGWYHNRRNHVVSKFPLVDPPGGGQYVFVEIAPGSVVAIANVHLPSDPYGVDWLRDGRAPDDVMALERNVRLPKIEPLLGRLAALYRRGIPVFLTGDFNSPSDADWTSAAIG